jgi:hypothetical protein
MRSNIILLMITAALLAAPQFAFADGDGAITGGAGGAVAGAVVGGPVGAAVGGVAGAVIGGATTGPNHPHDAVVVAPAGPPPATPCQSRTTQTTDNMGNSSTTQATNCP